MPLRLHALRTLGADAGELQDGLLVLVPPGCRARGAHVLVLVLGIPPSGAA